MDLLTMQDELIANRTDREYWYRLPRGATSPCPVASVGAVSGLPVSAEGRHHGRAVSREESSLTMSWGTGSAEEAQYFGWSEQFDSPTVWTYWVEFFWNNALIDRVELCEVDGGCGTIPLPNRERAVSAFEMAVACLIHGLGDGGHNPPGHYLNRIAATQVRDVERAVQAHPPLPSTRLTVTCQPCVKLSANDPPHARVALSSNHTPGMNKKGGAGLPRFAGPVA